MAFDCDIPKRSVKAALWDMGRRGEIERTGQGQYRHARPDYRPWPAPVRDKILRAMEARRNFSVRDLAIRSDADLTYIRQVIDGLVGQGDLIDLGLQTDPHTGETSYRFEVIDAERFFLKHVLKKEA